MLIAAGLARQVHNNRLYGKFMLKVQQFTSSGENSNDCALLEVMARKRQTQPARRPADNQLTGIVF